MPKSSPDSMRRRNFQRNWWKEEEALDSNSDVPNTSVATTSKPEKTKPALRKRLHFKKIIQAHTDETLGDSSFLTNCFHVDSCKYDHYRVNIDVLIDAI